MLCLSSRPVGISWRTPCLLLAALATAPAAYARPLAPGLDVCVVASERLSLNSRERPIALAEANTIWTPLGVHLRWTGPSDQSCDRKVIVKADTEILSGDAAGEGVLAWVLFVEGRARQLVFLRLDRMRRLIAGLDPGSRPGEMDRFLFARFTGRSLAHELGHVLLNTQTHTTSGLMRARYRPADVLRESVQNYTLDPAERAVLSARIDRDARLAVR